MQIVSGLIALLVVTAISCGMKNLCKRRDTHQDEESSSLGNGAAVSNNSKEDERCKVSEQLCRKTYKNILAAYKRWHQFQKLAKNVYILLRGFDFPKNGNFDLKICWEGFSLFACLCAGYAHCSFR